MWADPLVLRVVLRENPATSITPPVGLARADARRNLTARQSPQTEKMGVGGTRTAAVRSPTHHTPGVTHWTIGSPATSPKNIIYGFGLFDEIF